MLTNSELSQELRTLGNLLLIEGADDFRARRYARLADTIEALSEDVDALHRRGELTRIDGVGESTAAVLTEYIETGTSALRQATETNVPATLLDLLAISGIGPKTVQRLHQEHGIENVDALEQAIDDGKLHGMKGISAKMEQKMRDGIARLRRRNVERPLYEVLRLGEQIGETLNLVPEMSAIAPAGQARRGRELPRRVDLVAATENIGRACVVLKRVGLGDGSPSRVVHGEFGGGFPVRIVLTPSNYFGVTWLRETSDRAHLEALNERARDRDLPPLTEDEAWGRLDEAAVYERLGLPWIPHECREGSEALDRADAGSWPALIAREDYRGDVHSHTTASDGVSTLDEMADAAAALGYEYLAICDHSQAAAYANGLKIDRLRQQGDAIREVNERLDGSIRILAGSEVDVLTDGALDFPDDVLADLDWVVASVHSQFNLSEERQTTRICRAMENPYVRVVGHPTGRLLGIRDPYPVDVPALIEKAAETGVALELNSSPERLDLGADYCRLARDAGVPISINTDAHRRESLDSIRFGLSVARRAWLEPENVVNTWSLERLLAFRSNVRPEASSGGSVQPSQGSGNET